MTRATLTAAVLIAGCASTRPPPTAAPTATVLPAPQRSLPEDGRAPLTSALDERHHSTVRLLAAVEAPLQARIVALYHFDSFEAWLGYQRLEPFEREAAPWSANDEHDYWRAGLEVAGIDREAAARAQARFDQCAAEVDRDTGELPEGCDEPTVWATVLDQLDRRGCLGDRVALASFDEQRLREAHVLEGRRCVTDESWALFFQLDDDEALEVIAEVHWAEADAEGVELIILDDELEVRLRRPIFTRGRERSDEPVADGRWWLERRDDDLVLVLEQYRLAPQCRPSEGCSRLSRAPDEALDELLRPPCAPLDTAAETPCERQEAVRDELSRQGATGLWL